jgi:hypothetical protein
MSAHISLRCSAISLRNYGARHRAAPVRHHARASQIERAEQCGAGATLTFTTLLDYYALPQDFPQAAAPAASSPREKAIDLEKAMGRDVTSDRLWRFTPHLQLHEFEALLLADVEMFVIEFPDRARAIARLKAEIHGLAPEDVNGGR